MKIIRVVAVIFFIALLSLNVDAQSGPYLSFESHNYPEKFIRHAYGLGELTPIVTTLDMQDATFALVPGLADKNYVSFESFNYPGSYLRHQYGRINLHQATPDVLFKEDATFVVVPGLADPHAVSFESYNYPGSYLRHRDYHLWVERNDNSQLFKEDATFRIVAPKYGL